MAHPWALRTVGKRQKAKAKVKTQNAKVKTEDALRHHRRERGEGSALRPEAACKTEKSKPRLLALLTFAFCVLTFDFCVCITYPPSARCLLLSAHGLSRLAGTRKMRSLPTAYCPLPTAHCLLP